MPEYIIVKRRDLEKAIAYTKTGNYFKAGEQLLKAFNNAQPAKGHNPSSLTFNELRNANSERLKSSKYRKCEENWTPAHWIQATLGELGELANILKKVDRGDFSFESVKGDIADEVADVQTYLDILSFKLDIDLGQSTVQKFNKVSDRIGSDVYLHTTNKDTEQPSEAERRKIKLKITRRRNLEPMPIEDEAEQEQPITAQEAKETLDNFAYTARQLWESISPIKTQGAISTTHPVIEESYTELARYIEQTAQDREDAERWRYIVLALHSVHTNPAKWVAVDEILEAARIEQWYKPVLDDEIDKVRQQR